MRKSLGALLGVLLLASCQTNAKTNQIITQITTRALTMSDISYSASQGTNSMTVAVTALHPIKLLTVTFKWIYLTGSTAKTEGQTQKEIDQGEARSFTSTIDWAQSLAIKEVDYQFSGTAYN